MMFDTKFFPGAKKFWHMGELFDWNEITVHTMSHVLHYGSSVFEGIRAYDTKRGPAIFRLDEHVDRLFYSAKTLYMEVPYTKEEIVDAIKLTMKENRLRSAYIRPNLYYGYGNLGLVPKACQPELTIGCWGWGAYLGEEGVAKGVHVLLLPWKRVHSSQTDMGAKLGGLYVLSNIAGTYARKQGFEEGIFLNLEGRVAEGPGENIIIVKNEVVKTNDCSESILQGITRTTVLELAEDLGYKTEIGPITLEEFTGADEAFFTGTAAEVTPITKMTDGRDTSLKRDDWPAHLIGNGIPGEVTLKLAACYAEAVRGEHQQYDAWLTYVYDDSEEAKRVLEEIEEERHSGF
jgi:branched-chain amino acid aminotransferase